MPGNSCAGAVGEAVRPPGAPPQHGWGPEEQPQQKPLEQGHRPQQNQRPLPQREPPHRQRRRHRTARLQDIPGPQQQPPGLGPKPHFLGRCGPRMQRQPQCHLPRRRPARHFCQALYGAADVRCTEVAGGTHGRRDGSRGVFQIALPVPRTLSGKPRV